MTEYSWPWENDGDTAPNTAAAWPETVSALPVGTRITGEVIGRQPFGAFLSIDGCPEALGLARVNRMPRCMQLPAVGQRVTGEVIWHADHNCQVGIMLSEWAEHQDLLPRFRVGQVVVGHVTKIAAPIGFFVHLADCVEAFVPGSEAVVPVEAVSEGQEMSVRITGVDLARNRIRGSM
ncbi:S1 RNA-binding domain-containing protein [Streptomyces sp. NPDC088762]|uniref:S1 RNA-binding domain-containing protein n=1 Tax=Streptomyces sp. NPDC088762 TaxID=3365891 RepID=UPI00382939A0